MPAYPDALPVEAARSLYFEANGFGDGGYDAAWVKLKVGPIPLRFPNTAGRKAAVPMHDLHHVATGYDTDLAGEGEIGAWEIATGCFHVRAAWVLNSLAAWPVLFFAPGRLYRAFVRGRHSRNLYRGPEWKPLLAGSVGALREQLGLEAAQPTATPSDRLAFARFVATIAGLQVGIVVVFIGLPAWLLGAFG